MGSSWSTSIRPRIEAQIQGRPRRSSWMEDRRALDRLRRLVRVLHEHEVDEMVLITTAGVILAVEVSAFRDPLVTHEVPGAGTYAEWPLKWTEGFLVLGTLLPASAPRLDGSPDDTPGAVPVLVIDGDNVEVTFVLHADLERGVPS